MCEFFSQLNSTLSYLPAFPAFFPLEPFPTSVPCPFPCPQQEVPQHHHHKSHLESQTFVFALIESHFEYMVMKGAERQEHRWPLVPGKKQLRLCEMVKVLGTVGKNA